MKTSKQKHVDAEWSHFTAWACSTVIT